MEDLQFVNIHGHRVATALSDSRPKRDAKPEPESFHKGFRVRGIPPGALEEARAAHAKEVRDAGMVPGAKMPKEWDEGNWLMNAKRKAVRSKPYELESAAKQCADMAESAGWLRVEIVAIKKDA